MLRTRIVVVAAVAMLVATALPARAQLTTGSVAGTVKDVRVKAGDKVKVGQAILSVDGGAAGATPAAAPNSEREPSGERSAKAPRSDNGGAVGANTPEKIPAPEPGLEQHVEGAKRPSSASGRPEPV